MTTNAKLEPPSMRSASSASRTTQRKKLPPASTPTITTVQMLYPYSFSVFFPVTYKMTGARISLCARKKSAYAHMHSLTSLHATRLKKFKTSLQPFSKNVPYYVPFRCAAQQGERVLLHDTRATRPLAPPVRIRPSSHSSDRTLFLLRPCQRIPCIRGFVSYSSVMSRIPGDFYTVAAEQIAVGGYMLLNERPCRVCSIGKPEHGKGAVSHFLCEDIFDGTQCETRLPLRHRAFVPIVNILELPVSGVTADGFVTTVNVAGEPTSEFRLPSKLQQPPRGAFEIEARIRQWLARDRDFAVVVLAACGRAQIVDTRLTEASALDRARQEESDEEGDESSGSPQESMDPT